MKAYSLNLRGHLREFTRPAVMGIINVTDDSFWEGSRATSDADIAARAASLAAAGAEYIDIGACSTRPGAAAVEASVEAERLTRAISIARAAAPAAIISADTYRADVARAAVEAGADIINDVAGGNLDPDMYDTVAELRVPYVLGHMRGTPADMQEYTTYEDVTRDVLSELGDRYQQLALRGVADIIIDPCFGFSKTVGQNYELLARLDLLGMFHCPVLVGFSRKSMITRPLGVATADALDGTTVLNTLALDRGAAILRVHDVAPAIAAVKLYSLLPSTL